MQNVQPTISNRNALCAVNKKNCQNYIKYVLFYYNVFNYNKADCTVLHSIHFSYRNG